MEKVYEVTKPGRLNKRKVLGKESRAVLIKKTMQKVFRSIFKKNKTYPTIRGEIDPRRQMEIDSINKNIEETKRKMDILRNKEGELTLDETKFLHQYNKQLEKLKKMILVRKPGYIRYEKLKSFFAYRPEVQTQSIGEIVGQNNNVEDTIESNEISNENKQLEDSLKAQVERELNEQTVEPVASAPIEEQKVEVDVPTTEPVAEQKVEVDVPTTEPVTEQKVEPTVEQAPVAQEKDNNKNNFNVDETIKRANVLVEKAAKADKLETKVTELTKTVGEKDKEIQKLQTEKAKMSEDMQKKENDWKQQIQRVRNELDQLTKNFGLAEKENETLKQQLTDVNNAKQELEEKYNNVMQNLQNVMAENEKLNTFVESITPVLNSVTINYEDQPHVK
jgi:hypothetical protein